MRSRLCLCSVLVVLSAGAASAAAFRQWLPWESWPGGKQYDARLDRTVAFWHAGTTLEEVFESIRQQAGVTLTFQAQDDENRRVRVNLFLNRQQPATLRDLMVQLSWVVDCQFSMSEENGAIVYSLLSTSIGAGAEEALLARRAARVQAREQLWQSLDDALEECRQALLLSPQQAARTYRGVNDALLLTLLDPSRRAAAQVVCRHLTEARPGDWMASVDADVISNGTGLSATLLTPEDFADLHAALAVPESALKSEDRQSYIEVGLLGGDEAEVKLTLEPQLTTGPDGQAVPIGEYAEHIIVSLPKGRPLGATEEVQLRRLLGEQFTPEQEAAFVKQRTAELERAAQQRARDQEDAGRAVSEAARKRLTGLQLPFRHAGGAPRIPLWQVFEEIAKASGYHLVSDAFITGGVGVSLEQAKKLEGPPFEAWAELSALTSAPATQGFRAPQWEWGDAGSFLRFRTSNRDIYRAAMLPDSFLRFVDAVARRQGPVDEKARSAQFTIPIDVADWAGPLARLTDMQLQCASLVTQTAPDDLMGNVRQEVIKSVLSSTDSNRDLIRFLGSLKDAQWPRVRDEGLNGPAEVTPDQMQWLVVWAKSESLSRVEDFSRISVRIAETADDPNMASLLTTACGDPTYYLDARAWRLNTVRAVVDVDRGEVRETKEEMVVASQQGAFLPKQVTVHVERCERGG
jgi:hypothetical protein